MRFARTCYDHLAGVLAIARRDELLRRGALRHRKNAFFVTPMGKQFLRTLDIDVGSLCALRRSFAHKCLDWTERHYHIGGAVGAAVLSRFIEMKWLAREADAPSGKVLHVINVPSPAATASLMIGKAIVHTAAASLGLS